MEVFNAPTPHAPIRRGCWLTVRALTFGQSDLTGNQRDGERPGGGRQSVTANNIMWKSTEIRAISASSCFSAGWSGVHGATLSEGMRGDQCHERRRQEKHRGTRNNKACWPYWIEVMCVTQQMKLRKNQMKKELNVKAIYVNWLLFVQYIMYRFVIWFVFSL